MGLGWDWLVDHIRSYFHCINWLGTLSFQHQLSTSVNEAKPFSLRRPWDVDTAGFPQRPATECPATWPHDLPGEKSPVRRSQDRIVTPGLGFAWPWCLEKVKKTYAPKWWFNRGITLTNPRGLLESVSIPSFSTRAAIQHLQEISMSYPCTQNTFDVSLCMFISKASPLMTPGKQSRPPRQNEKQLIDRRELLLV